MPVDTIIGRGPLSGGTVIDDLTMAAGTRILFDNLEGSVSLPAIAFADAGGVYDTGIYQGGTNVLSFTLAGQLSYQFGQVSLVIQQGIGLAFDLGSGIGDAFIEIDAANILALSNGTNAQTWRIYETFTNVGNNQGLSIDAGVILANTITITPFENGSGSNDQTLRFSALGTGTIKFGISGGVSILDIGTDGSVALANKTESGVAKWTVKSSHDSVTLTGATTDTTTISVPSGARLLAVLMNVDTAVVNDGDNTWGAAFVTGSTTSIVSAGIGAATQNTKVSLMLPDEITTGVAQIRFTPQAANFTAGVIEVIAYYEELVPMANV